MPDTTTPENGQQQAQQGPGGTAEGPGTPEGQDGQQQPETFTREYVQQLRDDAAGHGSRAGP